MHATPIRHLLRLAVSSGLTIGLLAMPGATLAGGPAHVTHDRFEGGHEVTDLNICGDLGVFSFSGRSTVTQVELEDGAFHFVLVERGTYTLTFLDEPQETWESRFVERIAWHAPASGTFTFLLALNSFEGPVRIHETTTFVVGPDGSVRVDNQAFVVDGCPAG
jgi:hypothetical protein